MGTTTLLLLGLLGVLAMVAGVAWILWDDAAVVRRRRTDLKTCEAIWALSAEA